MSPYYELHITYLEAPDRPALPELKGWSHSVIEGDIILGRGPKHYLTHHAKGDAYLGTLVEDMEAVAKGLRDLGRTVLRTKVERVLYDRRTKA